MFPFGWTEIFWGTPDTGGQQLKSLEWGKSPLSRLPLRRRECAISGCARMVVGMAGAEGEAEALAKARASPWCQFDKQSLDLVNRLPVKCRLIISVGGDFR